MKKTGALMLYERERVTALMETFDECLQKSSFVDMDKLFEYIVQRPTCRFFVSETRARYVIAEMDKGRDIIAKMLPLKREMFSEIYRRVNVLRKERPDLSLYNLCSMVLNQSAPQFYLTPGTAKMMYYKNRKRWQAEKFRKRILPHLLH